ncbi:hypothetical protein PIROE2DRAFT_9317 [Piromyces sp. E2]|nr:hypothetical protein PIROE2DRAFT_9317 [Piromyces sp. E2]|eukprot:OUM64015.1 hypothetical protein PIROE2DRAFT_9317 [Piromyces sp. E2]
MNDITTSAKYLLYFALNDVNIDQVEMSNINCIGYDTSLMLLETGEKKSTTIFNFNKLTIQNSKSNGPLIKLTGREVDFILNNSKLYKITSYGSLIQNTSSKVY